MNNNEYPVLGTELRVNIHQGHKGYSLKDRAKGWKAFVTEVRLDGRFRLTGYFGQGKPVTFWDDQSCIRKLTYIRRGVMVRERMVYDGGGRNRHVLRVGDVVRTIWEGQTVIMRLHSVSTQLHGEQEPHVLGFNNIGLQHTVPAHHVNYVASPGRQVFPEKSGETWLACWDGGQEFEASIKYRPLRSDLRAYVDPSNIDWASTGDSRWTWIRKIDTASRNVVIDPNKMPGFLQGVPVIVNDLMPITQQEPIDPEDLTKGFREAPVFYMIDGKLVLHPQTFELVRDTINNAKELSKAIGV